MGTFASDTATDTSGTFLTAHTPEVGGPWVKHALFATGAALITTSNRIRTNVANTTAVYYFTANPITAEYDVQADFVVMGTPVGETSGICGRLDTSVMTCYLARYDRANGRWELAKIVNGGLTSLGTFTQALTAGTTYTVLLQIRDATKKLFVDGVERISSSDNAVTAAGKAGLRLFMTASPSDAASIQFDNLAANDATSLINSVAPAVTGTRVVGESLTATDGTWSGVGTINYAKQWIRDGADISGATGSSYILQSTDVGHAVGVRVTATDDNGSRVAISNLLTVVAEIVGGNNGVGDVNFWASALGVGGAPGARITSASIVWDWITVQEATDGDVEYRAIYLVNDHAVRTLASTVVWIAAQTSSPDTSIAIGVAPESAGASVTAVADEQTAPASVTFSTPSTSGAGISIGSLGPGQGRGIWMRRTTSAGAVAAANDAMRLSYSGDPS